MGDSEVSTLLILQRFGFRENTKREEPAGGFTRVVFGIWNKNDKITDEDAFRRILSKV
jgi:hypothetical protein